MKRLVPRAVLAIAGLLLLVVGASVLFNPVEFAATNGIVLPMIPSLLSEVRAPGGLLFVSGILAFVGVVQARSTQSGLALVALIYCSYGAARLLGVLLDGMPSAALVNALFIELSVGVACLATAFWVRAQTV